MTLLNVRYLFAVDRGVLLRDNYRAMLTIAGGIILGAIALIALGWAIEGIQYIDDWIRYQRLR